MERGAPSPEWFDGTSTTDSRPGSARSSASSSAESKAASSASSSGTGLGGQPGSGNKPRRRPGGLGGGRTVDEPLRPPGARGGATPLWAGTAADRDRALDAERQIREAARAQGRPVRRGLGGGGSSSRQSGSAYRPQPRAAPPPVQEYFVVSSDSEEEDWYDAHLASRWAKSKAQQAAKDEELRKAQAKRDAAYDAERAQEARERQAEAERESEQVRSTEVDWEKFAALPADSCIRMCDVPWPNLTADALGLNPSVASKAQRKQAFRSMSLRWHPDKFLQGFGSRLDVQEREAILQRVTEVAQAINSIYQEARGRA